MTPIPKIKELIDFLRSEGVLSYEENGIKLTLSPSKPQELPEVKKQLIKETRDPVFGLTEEEQFDLFNEVISRPEVK